MKTTPLIFTADSIRAMLDGRKSQTRRVVKPQPIGSEVYPPESSAPRQAFQWMPTGSAQVEDIDCRLCPHGQPGDLIWCKEGWLHGVIASGDLTGDEISGYHYRATEICQGEDDGEGGILENIDGSERSPWKSPIFMPRRASRLTLRLTDVRVERVQDISEADAKAEGVAFRNGYWMGGTHSIKGTLRCMPTAREAFLDRVTHGDSPLSKHGADAWVWALTYDVIHANVDDVLAAPEQYGVPA